MKNIKRTKFEIFVLLGLFLVPIFASVMEQSNQLYFDEPYNTDSSKPLAASTSSWSNQDANDVSLDWTNGAPENYEPQGCSSVSEALADPDEDQYYRYTTSALGTQTVCFYNYANIHGAWVTPKQV